MSDQLVSDCPGEYVGARTLELDPFQPMRENTRPADKYSWDPLPKEGNVPKDLKPQGQDSPLAQNVQNLRRG